MDTQTEIISEKSLIIKTKKLINNEFGYVLLFEPLKDE